MRLWPRRPRPVVIPDADAGELLRLVLLGLRVKARRTGAVASPRLVELLRDLHEAELRHHARVPAPTFAIETSRAAPATLDGDVLSVAEAAKTLGCSHVWVRVLARSGRLRARRAGRTWLIDRASLDAYRHHRE